MDAANYTIYGARKGALSSRPDSAAPTGGNTYTLTWNSGLVISTQNDSRFALRAIEEDGEVVSAEQALHFTEYIQGVAKMKAAVGKRK
jgi:hypothetical protein